MLASQLGIFKSICHRLRSVKILDQLMVEAVGLVFANDCRDKKNHESLETANKT